MTSGNQRIISFMIWVHLTIIKNHNSSNNYQNVKKAKSHQKLSEIVKRAMLKMTE